MSRRLKHSNVTTRLKKVSLKEAQDAARSLGKIDIQKNNWPEYLRKLGFSDNAVAGYLNKQDSLVPYWIKLKGEQGELDVGVEILVQNEVNQQKRNKKIDKILASNNVKECFVRNRNRAWFLYDFLSQYAGGDFFKHDVARIKFELTEQQMSQIESDYEGNSLEQRYQMLSTWVRAKNLTQLKKIAEALRKLDLVAPKIYNFKSKAGSSQDTRSSCEETDSCDEEIASHKEMVLHSLKDECKKFITSKIGQQELVPLQVTKQENVNPEELGNSSSWSFRKQTDKKNITPANLFDEAARTCDERAKSSHEPFNKQRRNVVGLTGMAGIGKTSFCKSILKQWTESHPESFVFYISSRDLSFENKKKYNVLKFLLASTDCDYKHNQESDEWILKKIAKSTDTLIIIDGLDEAKHKERFSEFPSAVKLCEENESAYNILMNLLNCCLLPNVKKVIASRPAAFQKFHPECKPSFMAHVLGLGQESQILLSKQITKTEEQQKRVQEALEKQPNLSALSFIPMFGTMIIKSFLDNQESELLKSITAMFLTQFEQWQKNHRFSTDDDNLQKVAKLAYEGVQNHQFRFNSKDLAKHDMAAKFFDPYMCVHTQNPQEPGFETLDGEKVFFFIHATWQEFLAALYLMVFASSEEFCAKLEDLLQQHHWEVVTRFLFGFCHQQTQAKLEVIFSNSQVVKNKESLLKSKFIELLPVLSSKLPGDFPVPPADHVKDLESIKLVSEFNSRQNDSTLFNICSWTYEAQDDDLTKAVANSLPSKLLLSREILPHEVICFCHVLEAADQPHMLNVGDWAEPATFSGAGLPTLLETVQQSKHKITKLHVRKVNLSVSFDLILKMLSDIIELALRECNLLISNVDELSKAITHRKIALSFLDLSFNDFHGVGNCLDGCICNVPMLRLDKCNLQDDDFASISNAVTQRDKNMEWLDLNRNVMSQNALDSLAPSVYKLDGMSLGECSVNGDGLKLLCLKIKNRRTPMTILNLTGNNIGSIGLNHVSSCIHNLLQLWLDNCNLTGTCLPALFFSILALDNHSMNVLSITGNKVDEKDVPSLANVCYRKSKVVIYANCGVDIDDVNRAIEEIKVQDVVRRMIEQDINRLILEAITRSLNERRPKKKSCTII